MISWFNRSNHKITAGQLAKFSLEAGRPESTPVSIGHSSEGVSTDHDISLGFNASESVIEAKKEVTPTTIFFLR